MEEADKGSQDNNPTPTAGSKGKSCKGCLYYSSLQKSKSKNPTCVGFSRTLQQVPSYIVGETELEASKEGRSLTDFRYACIGYSVYLDRKDLLEVQNKQAELPFCVGLEILLDKRPAEHSPAHMQKSEETGPAFPPPRTYKPSPHAAGDEYLARFKRNASLVASGVARNMNRLYNRVKESLDDILYPYRRRPK